MSPTRATSAPRSWSTPPACGARRWRPWPACISPPRRSITSTSRSRPCRATNFRTTPRACAILTTWSTCARRRGGLVVGGYELNPAARWVDGAPWDHGGASPASRFRPLRAAAGGRHPAHPVPREGRNHHGRPAPRGLHARQPADARADARRARLLVRHRPFAQGYGGAGGMGKVLAEWIIEGEPSLDIFSFHAWRFGRYYADPIYAAERTREGVKYYYLLRFPNDENEWARPHRVSPVHDRLQELGAVFGEKNGWERVNYFQPGKPSRRMGADQREWGWKRPPYFERVGQEHVACRERVAHLRYVVLRQDRPARPRRAAAAAAPDGQPDGRPGRARGLHPVPQHRGQRRGRRDHHPAGARLLPRGHRLQLHRQRPGLRPHGRAPGRPAGRDPRCDRGAGDLRAVGAEGARGAAGGLQERRLQQGHPLHGLGHDRHPGRGRCWPSA